MSSSFDVMIVGASVAGSTLAIRLGRSGIKTLLVDKSEFPRRKTCGEGLSNVGLENLRRLLDPAALEELPHHRYRGYQIWRGDSAMTIPFSDSEGGKNYAWGIQRSVLDAHLLKCAGKLDPVSIKTGTQIRSVNRESGRWTAQVDGESVTAAWLVLADGANSFLAEKVGVRAVEHSSRRYGYGVIVAGRYRMELPYVSLFLRGPIEVIATPIAPRQLNVTAFVEKTSMSTVTASDWLPGVLADVSKKLHFEPTGHDEPQAIKVYSRAPNRPPADQVLLVGDCCETLDPIGGMGMTHAILSSELAAEALADILGNGVDSKAAITEYDRRRERAVRPLRGFTRLTNFLLRRASHTALLPIAANSGLMSIVGGAVNQAHPASGAFSSPARAFITLAGMSK